MKLALIRRRFASTGGAELYLQRLLTTLREAGHDLHLFAEAWEETPAGVTLHPQAVRASRARRPVVFAEQVEAALARERFDCIFSLERTLRQDVYRAGDGVHRVWLERRRQFAPWWRRPFIGRGAFHRHLRALEARTFDPTHTGRVIVNSEMVRREIVANFGFPEERIHLVRNGITVERFQGGNRAATRARFGVGDDEYLLLFVGSGWERKGLKYLLAAMHTVPEDTKLLVVGKGRPPCFAPRHVIFAGPMREVENAYAAADLFVFPPIYEPSANVVFEALAAGLPVVTSAFNGAAEVLEPGRTGTVLPDPSDIAALTGAIGDWRRRRSVPREACTDRLAGSINLERNVRDTVAILEQARSDAW